MGFLNRMRLSYTLSDSVRHHHIFQADITGERKNKWEGALGMCPGTMLFLIAPSLLLLLDISEIRKKEFWTRSGVAWVQAQSIAINILERKEDGEEETEDMTD